MNFGFNKIDLKIEILFSPPEILLESSDITSFNLSGLFIEIFKSLLLINISNNSLSKFFYLKLNYCKEYHSASSCFV